MLITVSCELVANRQHDRLLARCARFNLIYGARNRKTNLVIDVEASLDVLGPSNGF